MSKPKSDNRMEPSLSVSKLESSREIINEKLVVVDKIAFVSFLAEVVNCSVQPESRTERIKIIITAAEKYLDVEGVTVEQINDKLKMQMASSQAPCGGS